MVTPRRYGFVSAVDAAIRVQTDAAAARGITKRLGFVLAITVVFMLCEAVGGWLSGSLALVADAGHMLADSAALFLALISAWIATRPADDKRTYGWARGEVLAALINGVALLVISGIIVYEAIERIREPTPIRTGLFAIVAVGGLAINLLSLKVLHGHQHLSLNTRAAYLHIMGDVLGSVGALVAAGVIAMTGWTAADPIVSVIIALLIVSSAWRLVRESVDVLLEAAPDTMRTEDVRQAILTVPGVASVHDVHLWTVSSGVVAMSAHATVPDLHRHQSALTEIRAALGELGVALATVQLEVETTCARLGPEDAPAPHLRHTHGATCEHGHSH